MSDNRAVHRRDVVGILRRSSKGAHVQGLFIVEQILFAFYREWIPGLTTSWSLDLIDHVSDASGIPVLAVILPDKLSNGIYAIAALT